MKNDTTIEKMVSEKDQKVENVKLPKDTDANVHKGDFVLLVKMKIQTNSLVYLK